MIERRDPVIHKEKVQSKRNTLFTKNSSLATRATKSDILMNAIEGVFEESRLTF